jgi:two-component system response regulator AtoC
MNEEWILVVDDEENMRQILARLLGTAGYHVLTAASAEEAIRTFSKRRFALVITDLVMPDTDGLGLLAALKELDSSIPVVMVTAYGTVETAVAAMKKGAYDYVLKPFDNNEILFAVRKAISSNKDRNIKLYRSIPGNLLIGTSEKMARIYEVIDKIADSMGTVLIRGETGTGKELVAREIHRRSSRGAGPFICVNCAALPDTLLESELFGYEKGAFTGAVNSKPGRFEFARDGTIFLDEIGDMSLLMQTKLLRILQDKTVTRLGGTRAVEIDVRIIAATNKDIERARHDKEFRQDLYYRINVLNLSVPPLREHKEDIPDIAWYFVEHYSKRNNRPVKTITPDGLNRLLACDWPGNVRELENVIERAVIMSVRGKIEAEDLGFHGSGSRGSNDLKDAVRSTTAEIEKQAIIKALAECDGNRSKAARKLGISRRTIINKIAQYGIV